MTNYLFLDIETVSAAKSYQELPERMKLLWDKKASAISKGEGDPKELYEERAGIFSEFGKIIVIGLGFLTNEGKDDYGLRAKVLASHDEKQLLNDFKNILNRFNDPQTILVAHNGKEFDFPYIARRMLINSISLPEILQISGKKPWEIQHQDTMEMWKFGDWKSYTSLDLLAAVFDIPSSKSDIDGSMVSHVYHNENDLIKISEYCIRDVIVCAQVFLSLKGLPTIPEDQIKIVN